MSETLIPAYYNVKIGNNDWQIYMGGKRYFPAYPAKWVEPEPPGREKKVVKRYLIKDSSRHEKYSNHNPNKFPLSLLEAYINENNETMEFEGNTYYVWRGWNENNVSNIVEPDAIWNGPGYGEQLIILTTTLEPELPFSHNSSEFAYMLTADSQIDETEYIASGPKYTFVAQVNEYEDGEKKVMMSNVGVRMYNYEHTENLINGYKHGDGVWDYFQYDGEIVEYEGQRCFVWNRYDTDRLCPEEGWDGDYNAQKILTNTLWISSLPFTMSSPEFVTWINFDDQYPDEPMDDPFDRIEYLPDTVYSPNPIDMEEVNIDINVRTYLTDYYMPPLENPENRQYVYEGETMEWNGKTCYVWTKRDLTPDKGQRYVEYPYRVLTNTLDITVPFDYNADYFEAAFDYDDNIANYRDEGPNTIGAAGMCAYRIIRDSTTHYNPPVYKTIIAVK